MRQHPRPLLASPSRRDGARATPSIQARGATDGVMLKSEENAPFESGCITISGFCDEINAGLVSVNLDE